MLQIIGTIEEPDYSFVIDFLYVDARWTPASRTLLYWEIDGGPRDVVVFWIEANTTALEAVTVPASSRIEINDVADIVLDLPESFGLPVINMERHSMEVEDGKVDEMAMWLAVGKNNVLLSFDSTEEAQRVVKCREANFYITSSGEVHSIQFRLNDEQMMRWRKLYELRKPPLVA